LGSRARLEVVTTLHQLIAALSEQPDRSLTTNASPQRDLPLLLDAAEAAKLLSLSRTKVFDLAHSGEIPSIRIGRAMRIPRDQLVAWIEQRTTEASHVASVNLPNWARADRSSEL
jgi:excisionase family DNA binding protein